MLSINIPYPQLPDVDSRIKIGDNCFLDDEIPRNKWKKEYVRGQVESIRWEESRDGEERAGDEHEHWTKMDNT